MPAYSPLTAVSWVAQNTLDFLKGVEGNTITCFTGEETEPQQGWNLIMVKWSCYHGKMELVLHRSKVPSAYTTLPDNVPVTGKVYWTSSVCLFSMEMNITTS